MKTILLPALLLLSAINSNARADMTTSIKFPLECVRYYDDRPLNPKELTVIFERLPNDGIKMSRYEDAKLVDQASDWKIAGYLPDGRLDLHSPIMLNGLEVDEQTGRGIFWTGFGEAVQCEENAQID